MLEYTISEEVKESISNKRLFISIVLDYQKYNPCIFPVLPIFTNFKVKILCLTETDNFEPIFIESN